MGTYEKPSLIIDPRSETLRKAGTQIAQSGLQTAANLKKQEELNRIRRNKLNEELYGLDLAVNSMPDADDKTFDDSVDNMLQDQLKVIHKLGAEALRTGDNSKFLKERAAFEAMVKQMPVVINAINREGEIWNKSSAEGVGSFLQGKNDPWKINLMENWNKKDGKDIIPKYVNGQLVLEYNGNIVNTSNLIKNLKEGGSGLITYMDDPQPALQQIFTIASGGKNYKGYQYIELDKSEVTGKKAQITRLNYKDQNNEIRDKLMNPGKGGDPLVTRFNQNNWEFFNKGTTEIYNDTPEQRAKLRKQMVDFMMTNYGHDDIVNVGETPYVAPKEESKYNPAENKVINDIKYISKLEDKNMKFNEGVNILNTTAKLNKSGQNYYSAKDVAALIEKQNYKTTYGKNLLIKIAENAGYKDENGYTSTDLYLMDAYKIKPNQIYTLNDSQVKEDVMGNIKRIINNPIIGPTEDFGNALLQELNIDYVITPDPPEKSDEENTEENTDSTKPKKTPLSEG